jgi:uncharacterized damage-inducible protein DinB
MDSMEIIRAIFAYDVATWRRVWDSIATLTPGQCEQPIAYSHGSVRDQMLHVTRVSIAWLMGLKGQPGGQQFQLDPSDFPTIASIRTRWEAVAEETLAHVNGLTDEDLAGTLPGMMGPTWQVLVHLVNHGTDHRAQVLRDLADLGAPSFAQDMIFQFWFAPR